MVCRYHLNSDPCPTVVRPPENSWAQANNRNRTGRKPSSSPQASEERARAGAGLTSGTSPGDCSPALPPELTGPACVQHITVAGALGQAAHGNAPLARHSRGAQCAAAVGGVSLLFPGAVARLAASGTAAVPATY